MCKMLKFVIYIFFDLVVESTTSQSFVTRQLIKKTSNSVKVNTRVIVDTFPGWLKPQLQDHHLHFDRRSMDMKSLEVFVKYGLKMENEYLEPYCNALAAAKLREDMRKNRERD